MEQKELSQDELMALLSRIREGEDEAFEALCELYAPLLRNMVARFSAHSCEADNAELSQEARYALYKASVTYSSKDGAVTFGLYARICVYHKLIDYKKKNGAEAGVCSIDELADVFVEQDADPSASMISAERVAEIYRKAASVLSSFERQIFDLCLVEEFSIAKTASVLGKSEVSVRNALFRVRTKLKAAL